MNIDKAIAELNKIRNEKAKGDARHESNMRVKFSDLRRILVAMKEPEQSKECEHVWHPQGGAYCIKCGTANVIKCSDKTTEKDKIEFGGYCPVCITKGIKHSSKDNCPRYKTTKKELVPLDYNKLLKLAHETDTGHEFILDIIDKFGTKPRNEPSLEEIKKIMYGYCVCSTSAMTISGFHIPEKDIQVIAEEILKLIRGTK
jgi:hypothetical protein